jgi:ketosteroid isomerase-like protein/predicted aspartyl protease
MRGVVRVRRFYRHLARLRLPFFLAAMSFPVGAQEIPLKHCDALPVVEVTIGDRPMLFLVDTAATSLLNLSSFTTGKAQGARVTSWTGTLATSGRQVTLDALTVGNTKLMRLEMLAVDLSAIGKACGRKIDGVLGMDLLAKLGATIDMKRQLMHVATASEVRGQAATAEMMGEMHRCVDAFNESDEKTFAECLDPKIVLFTAGAELYGREQTIGYFRERYFHQKPAARLEIRESAYHPIGDAIWYEYEFAIESKRGVLRGRGMAMCRKSEGHWRMASMHHSVVEFEPGAVERQSR